MTGERERRIQEISEVLGERRLVWFGIRGEDAAALLPIPQFSSCFGITAPLHAAKLEDSLMLEDLTHHRVDLDAYDIDFDDRAEVQALRSALLRALARPSAVTTYRPSAFLSDISFAASETSLPLGLFKDRQTAFEHKPWVETELARRGVRTIPWQYVPSERRSRLPVGDGFPPLVLRPSRASGGVGIAVVSSRDEVEAAWNGGSGRLMGVAPFLKHAMPLNVNACVFDAHTVTIHPASVQLIGLRGWTSRRFGFCGNDFGAIRHVAAKALDEIDATTRTIGCWLGEMGYRGVFGVDYLLDGDRLFFTEVNARMQGSSRVAASLAVRSGHVDLLLDHLAAFLGISPGPSLTVGDWRAELPAAAQIVKHHLGAIPMVAPPVGHLPVPDDVCVSLVPQAGVRIEPGAVKYCLEFDHEITTTGFDLIDATLLGAAVGSAAAGGGGSQPATPGRGSPAVGL